MLHPQAANFFLNGRRPVPLGNRHPNLAPYEKYMTKTGLIFIACGNDGQFGRLCELAGKPELASDPRFRSNADRLANRDALIGELQAVLAEEDGRALAERALHLGVPVGPVLAVDEALAAPQTGTRQILASLDGYRGIGTPIRFSRTPGSVRRKPPRFAEHTDEVLAAHGFTAAEVAELKQSGALRTVRRK
jgi:formyl-CoA transferase